MSLWFAKIHMLPLVLARLWTRRIVPSDEASSWQETGTLWSVLLRTFCRESFHGIVQCDSHASEGLHVTGKVITPSDA